MDEIVSEIRALLNEALWKIDCHSSSGSGNAKQDRYDDAVSGLVGVVVDACRVIEALEVYHPEAVRKVAGEKVKWPMVFYHTREVSDGFKGVRAKSDEISQRFSRIGLGKGLPVSINPKHESLNIAILDFVEDTIAFRKMEEPVGLWDSIEEECQPGSLVYGEQDQIHHYDQAEKNRWRLPDLEKDTAKEWAKSMVDYAYNLQKMKTRPRVVWLDELTSSVRIRKSVRDKALKREKRVEADVNGMRERNVDNSIAESWREDGLSKIKRDLESLKIEKDCVQSFIERILKDLLSR
ncbi:hypothetical protein [Pelagicoccus albus]|uniref:Uncharacterized protein n=1 Tax=Pelagicoccus albus TaxID=415222 RepID=A0A7X1E882_9BACT|nr:hypothetical protein [Pelagicoccus albus]MBC2606079.1 hypothetical protein [Pelagicoccus albus]